MRSSKAIILFGTLLQVLVFIGQRVFGQFFSSQPILAPLRGSEMVVGFIVGALIDVAVGYWFLRSKLGAVSRRVSQAITFSSLAAASTRLISTVISLFVVLIFVVDRSFFQETLPGPGGDAALLNIALVSLGPICSSTLMGAVFGGLGGFMAKSSRSEATEKNSLE
jgi:hypothetical protein